MQFYLHYLIPLCLGPVLMCPVQSSLSDLINLGQKLQKPLVSHWIYFSLSLKFVHVSNNPDVSYSRLFIFTPSQTLTQSFSHQQTYQPFIYNIPQAYPVLRWVRKFRCHIWSLWPLPLDSSDLRDRCSPSHCRRGWGYLNLVGRCSQHCRADSPLQTERDWMIFLFNISKFWLPFHDAWA